MGKRELAGIPPEKEMILGSAARLIKRRISDERMLFALAENSTILIPFKEKTETEKIRKL
jgi:hypothetical protein